MWSLWGVLVLVPLLVVALYYILPHATGGEGVVVDGDFGLRAVSLAGVAFGWLVANSTLLFTLLTPTIEAIGIDGERVATNYDSGRYFKKVLGWSALTVITLGLFAPWMFVRQMRYFFSGATYRHRQLGLHSHSMGLFTMIILVILLPIMVVAFLMDRGVIILPNVLSLETHTLVLGGVILLFALLLWFSFFYAVFMRWLVNMSCGEERIVATVPIGRTMMYIMGQMMFTILTLGLYTPMMELRLLKYFAETVEVGEEHPRRMGMSLRSWRDWGYVWGQALLVVITLGIYLPWYYTKILSRFIPRIFILSDK